MFFLGLAGFSPDMLLSEPLGGSWNGCIHLQTKFVEVPSVDVGVLGRQVKCSELLFMAIDQETLLDRQAESVLECLNSQTLQPG